MSPGRTRIHSPAEARDREPGEGRGGDALERGQPACRAPCDLEHVVVGVHGSAHYDQESEPDRIREQRFMLGVALARAGRDRLRRVRGEQLLAPRLARPQHVEAHARDDRRQPAAQVLDHPRVRATEPQPRLLHGVVRVGE